MSNANFQKSRWLRDVVRFLPLKSQFVLSGNVKDLQIYQPAPNTVAATSLTSVLGAELYQIGYKNVLAYDVVTGFRGVDMPGSDRNSSEDVLRGLGLTPSNGVAPAGHDLLNNVLDRLIHKDGPPVALIIELASRLLVRNDVLSAVEHQLFSRALSLSQSAKARPFGENRQPFFNTIIWVVDKEGDLPDWFIVDNPRIRNVPVAKPDGIMRRALATSLLRTLPGGREASPPELEKAEQAFVDETEGLLLVDLNAIAQLGRSEAVPFHSISDAVRRYKVGVTEDPWQKIDRSKIRDADDFIRRRVKGQSHAVTHMLDIVKRAVMGVGGSRRGGRPRGVAFFSGPTGVGKTELAKTITHLLFGDENAYIRFDMSEFSAEHADQRLIGAPPGYVGYDVGGELTNAVREKPFSVVLFDEIEKAHPRILDKFLQVLDDGVLTSGRGDRIYFSETFIVFTSNLGIYSTNALGERVANVVPTEPFESVQAKVRSEIDKYFKLVLNRPEILNRIGENIIVFDFIRADVAEQIFEQMVGTLLQEMVSSGVTIRLHPAARTVLKNLCLTDLSNGGRGIRNQMEAHLLNPLSRALFDLNAGAGSVYEIKNIQTGAVTQLELAVVENVA